MRSYDNIDPEQYELRHASSPMEAYTEEHWRPLVEELINKYCTQGVILDLGCGTGAYTRLIADIATGCYVGLDRSIIMLAFGKSRCPKLNFILADAHNLPVKSESVDVITCIGLFEYVNRPVVFDEIERVLKFNGICVILCPNKFGAVRTLGRLAALLQRKKYPCDEPSYREMRNLLYSRNFRVVELKMDDGLILLPNVLSRFHKQVYRTIERLFSVFGRNPFSNVMLYVVTKSANVC